MKIVELLKRIFAKLHQRREDPKVTGAEESITYDPDEIPIQEFSDADTGSITTDWMEEYINPGESERSIPTVNVDPLKIAKFFTDERLSPTFLEKNSSLEKVNASLLEEYAQKIESIYRSFDITVKIININPGISFDEFCLKPGAGIRINSIKRLRNDLQLHLRRSPINILVKPGKDYISVMIPNNRGEVYLGDAITKQPSNDDQLLLGIDNDGAGVYYSPSRCGNLLIVANSGSPINECINTLLANVYMRENRDSTEIWCINNGRFPNDGIEIFNKHISQSREEGIYLLKSIYNIVKSRSRVYTNYHLRYDNHRKYYVIIPDILSLFRSDNKEDFNDIFIPMIMDSKNTGIYFIVGLQEKVKTRIPKSIVSLFKNTILFNMSSDSIGTSINYNYDAAFLKNEDSFLYISDIKNSTIYGDLLKTGSFDMRDYHNQIINMVKKRDAIMKQASDIEKAVELFLTKGEASISLLQSEFGWDYKKAVGIITLFESKHLIEPFNGTKSRKVLISELRWQQIIS